ncbi:MAG: aldehyde dehydrogenase family protein, partial [Chloroflexi bacterium]|nr:aldehyde dehydrogenase family protein [Chloroflexota bacterium]
MELGGKSPNIVFEDADLDKAIAGVLGGFTAAAGQSCVCGSRALIQESVYRRVVDAVAEGVKKIKIGDPSKPETDMGPFCTIQQLEKVKRFVEQGKKEGARVVVGGSQPQEPKGWFFEPTVFADVKNSMTIAQEEIFGPVLSALSFKDEAEAVRIANDTRFGLAAGLWTRDISRAHRVARELRAGTIWINQYRRGDPAFPFGGFKESGYGRENGRDAILEFTQAKSVQIELGG